jgi:hypothetical protein
MESHLVSHLSPEKSGSTQLTRSTRPLSATTYLEGIDPRSSPASNVAV